MGAILTQPKNGRTAAAYHGTEARTRLQKPLDVLNDRTTPDRFGL